MSGMGRRERNGVNSVTGEGGFQYWLKYRKVRCT